MSPEPPSRARIWFGLAGADGPGALGALATAVAEPAAADQPPLSDAVLLLKPPALGHVLARLPQTLGQQPPPGWPGRDAPLPQDGLHPLHLGALTVLLAIDTDGQLLRQLCGQAHTVWLGPDAAAHLAPAGWPLARGLGALARCCQPHATVQLSPPLATEPLDPETAAALRRAGFEPTDCPGHWRYAPRWPTAPHPTPPAPESEPHTTTPSGPSAKPLRVSDAIVIGAGLAGAATAWALTRRGCSVTLLDAHPTVAAGASGLPVGLMTEYLSTRDTPLSALSRSGVALHQRHLQRLLPCGSGWQPTRVANLKDAPPHALAALESLLHDPARAPLLQSGALIRPAALIQAWLQEAQATGRLHIQPSHPVRALQAGPRPAQRWLVLGPAGAAHAARHVVVAAAYGSLPLLQPWMPGADTLPLRAVKGQLTFGPAWPEPHAPCPVRHRGVWVPHYLDRGWPAPIPPASAAPCPNGHAIWAMGSTYERGQTDTTPRPASRAANLQSLRHISPADHARVQDQARIGWLSDWAGVRCASLDRLPLAGPLPRLGHPIQPHHSLQQLPRQDGLWTLCALGSRGLSLAALLGEYIAARICQAPWPLTLAHAQALDPARFALRAARHASAHSR